MVDTIHTDHYAGEFLKTYERERYSFLEKALLSYDFVRSIISPIDAEEFSDVSFYQPGVDWDEYAKHFRGVILRLGQGIWEDTEFQTNYTEAKKRGLLVGGYWFCDDRYSPSQQRDKLLSITNGKKFELEVWFDWENTYNGAFKGLGEVVALMQICEGKIACKDIGVYTGYYWFVENSSPVANASHYNYLKNKPLWLAWYASASIVKTPPPWTDYRTWQYGTPVLSWWKPRPANIDMNRSRFAKDEYTAFYGTGEIPQPPPNGGAMRYKAQAIANSTKTRPNHNTVTDFNPVRYHNAGTEFEGDLVWIADQENKDPSQYDGDKWLDVKKINGVDVAPCWVAVVHRGNDICTLVDNGPTTPPATGDIVVNAVFKADGTVTGTWTRT